MWTEALQSLGYLLNQTLRGSFHVLSPEEPACGRRLSSLHRPAPSALFFLAGDLIPHYFQHEMEGSGTAFLILDP